jgi:hypothetical protein
MYGFKQYHDEWVTLRVGPAIKIDVWPHISGKDGYEYVAHIGSGSYVERGFETQEAACKAAHAFATQCVKDWHDELDLYKE